MIDYDDMFNFYEYVTNEKDVKYIIENKIRENC